MEKQYVHSINGQGVYSEDLNTLGESSGLADDRVLAELFRLRPNGGTTAKAIIPANFTQYCGSQDGSFPSFSTDGLVTASTGAVVVRPFRAMLGSLTTEGSNSKESWRGIRSGVWTGPTYRLETYSLAANPSGSTRWDLVVAVVQPDLAASTVTRKVKNPTDGTVTTETVAVTKSSPVTVQIVQGTAGAGVPATPSDSGGSYYILLAKIRVPAGFTASTVLTQANVVDMAPVIALSTATGAVSLKPSTLNSVAPGTFSDDPSVDFPSQFLPPTMAGGEGRLLALDFSTAIASDSVVDCSMDWRGRIINTVAITSSTTSRKFPWEKGMATQYPAFGFEAPSFGANTVVQVGHTMATHPVSGLFVAFYGTTAAMSAMTQDFTLYADASSGYLKVKYTTKPANKVFLWITASGQFHNRNINW